MENSIVIKVVKAGPLSVKGSVKVILSNGDEKIVENPYLCRCGQSKNKPFCDGSHKNVDFDK